jgi:predicted GNAT superfamily acetyltransferase
MTYPVRPATTSDVDGIMEVASAWETADLSSERGFFVSKFTADEYRAFLMNNRYSVVVEDGHQVVGFLLALTDIDAQGFGDYNALWLSDKVDSFLICKRIAVAPHLVGRKIATSLYGHVMAQLDRGQALVAAIVEDPPNNASRHLHERLGFVDAYRFRHRDGRGRTIWLYRKGTLAQTD